jgi:ribosomal protein S8E
MTVIQLVQKNKNLIQAFKRYRKRYLSIGKKPNVKKLLPEDMFSTMRLEGEKVTRKAIQALFK